MSPKNSQNTSKAKANPYLKSSIVHKPFATGTVNIFNPHRQKSQERAIASNLDAGLAAALESTPAESKHNWYDGLLNPWSITAIAVVLSANLISGAVIWRSYRSTAKTEVQPELALGSADLTADEFVPLNLSTLSVLKTAEDTVEAPAITPIAPALAPLNSVESALDPEYYYVLSQYSGDRSLALARQKVPQISLVNFPEGVFIYLGAFKEREQATEFISQLAAENFPARIYPFD